VASICAVNVNENYITLFYSFDVFLADHGDSTIWLAKLLASPLHACRLAHGHSSAIDSKIDEFSRDNSTWSRWCHRTNKRACTVRPYIDARWTEHTNIFFADNDSSSAQHLCHLTFISKCAICTKHVHASPLHKRTTRTCTCARYENRSDDANTRGIFYFWFRGQKLFILWTLVGPTAVCQMP
jgi:hypothetical protein